jgi:hypothetical protein
MTRLYRPAAAAGRTVGARGGAAVCWLVREKREKEREK